MKTILWYQSPSADGKSIYNIDGKVSEFANTPSQIAAMDLMKEASTKWHNVKNSIWGKYYDTGLYIHPLKGVLLKSHFKSVDDHNRKIAYMFYSSDLANASKLLTDYAAMQNMELPANESEQLNQSIQSYRNKLRNISVSVLSLTILMVLAICLIK